KNKKIVIISMPVIIGLLPSLGGAYFSAPMVEETTKDSNITREEKSFINYWFRHIWECILPLYPGIMLVSAITTIDLQRIIIYNLPITLSMLFIGFYLSMRNISGNIANKIDYDSRFHSLWYAFLPIVILIFIVLFFGVELYLSLIILIVSMVVFYKIKIEGIIEMLRYGFTKDVFLLIFGVMFFKQVLEISDAINSISAFFNNVGLSILPILIILPFITGLLTGITVAFVGTTFPIIIGISGGIHVGDIMVSFVSGYIGVLLSPVHLCLLLTRDFFSADLNGIYRKIIPASVFTAVVCILCYFFANLL
ncbi:MAG: DUF401 family protein, partial [Thermodesulfovibrionales bacterium]